MRCTAKESNPFVKKGPFVPYRCSVFATHSFNELVHNAYGPGYLTLNAAVFNYDKNQYLEGLATGDITPVMIRNLIPKLLIPMVQSLKGDEVVASMGANSII